MIKITRKKKIKFSRPRALSDGYQKFQNAQMLTAMRLHLSSDGLCKLSSTALAKIIGMSQSTANRLILRLVAEKHVHLVIPASDRDGNPVNSGGHQVTHGILPWRRPKSSVTRT